MIEILVGFFFVWILTGKEENSDVYYIDEGEDNDGSD